VLDSLKLLQHLQINGPASGEVLGDAFGVSRAAVNKRMKLLDGYVSSSRTNGYSLRPNVVLANEATFSLLAEYYPKIRFDYQLEVGSTNDELMAELRTGDCSERMLFCEHQTKGRGRRGRQWLQPPGTGIQLSYRKQLDCDFSGLAGLSLAVGVYVSRAVEKLGFDVQLKWPNDIYLNAKKVGGVLIEVDGDFNGPANVVIGVGLNVGAIPDLDVDIAMLRGADKDLLVGALAKSLIEGLSAYSEGRFAAVRDEWLDKALWINESVQTYGLSENVSGVLTGVSNQGELIIDGPGGQVKLSGGEISLREAAC